MTLSKGSEWRYFLRTFWMGGQCLLIFALWAARASCLVPNAECNRICRYKSVFFDGNVCIGCFRSVDEIRAWPAHGTPEWESASADAAERRTAWDESAALRGEPARLSVR